MNTEHCYKRILVATDFSGESEAALKQAVWLSKKSGASITLAHVLQTLRNPVTSESDPKMDPRVVPVERSQRNLKEY